jgi:hypothetical protein
MNGGLTSAFRTGSARPWQGGFKPGEPLGRDIETNLKEAAMNKILTGGLAAQASARGWDHHGNGGAAVVAGIAGLAIGAALASDHPYYAPAPAYYEGPAYYAAPGYDRDYDDCRVQWRWSPRWGHYERVRVCH